MTHRCPVGPHGPATLSDDILMCPAHWRHVPQRLRRAVWAAWKNGAGAGTDELAAAQLAAVKAVTDHATPDDDSPPAPSRPGRPRGSLG